jgi:hypothetical protein
VVAFEVGDTEEEQEEQGTARLLVVVVEQWKEEWVDCDGSCCYYCNWVVVELVQRERT